MGRRRNRNAPKFYCPKCSRKTLVKEESYQRHHGTWYTRYRCMNQPPKWIERLHKEIKDATDEDGVLDESQVHELAYEGYEARHGSKKKELQAEQRAKVAAHFKKNPPCDCVIEKDGADAQIVDYHSVLDLLIRDGEAIRHHLLETNNTIHQKGFEVLYSSERCDVVRLRDKKGVGVYLYWKATWEPDYDGPKIETRILTHTAASYHTFREVPLPKLFRQTQRLLLWSKEEDTIYNGNPVFTGGLGKKRKAEIVDFAKGLESQLENLTAIARAARDTWEEWGKRLKADVRSLSTKVHVSGFDQVQGLAAINIHGWLPPEKVKAIAAVLAEPAEVEAS